MRRYLEKVIMRDEVQAKKALLTVSSNWNWFIGRGMPKKTAEFLTSLAAMRDKLSPRQMECGRKTLLRYVWLLLERLGEDKVLYCIEKMGEPDEDGCYANAKTWPKEPWE